MLPISENTRGQYRTVLSRATGQVHEKLADYAGSPYDYEALSPGMRRRFRAALQRCWEEAGDKARGIEEADRVNTGAKLIRTRPRPLLEREIVLVEKAVQETATPARALVIAIMFKLGLRVTEFLSLSREDVELAVEVGYLTFTRKGGTDKTLPTSKATPLFNDLLRLPRVLPHALAAQEFELQRRTRDEKLARWVFVREVVSMGTPQVAYNMVWRALDLACRNTPVRFSPHWLRRAFSTRMRAHGADLLTIQKALGHEHPATTRRYIHDDDSDVLEHMP